MCVYLVSRNAHVPILGFSCATLQALCVQSGVTHQDIAGHEGIIRTQDMQVDLDLGNYGRFLDVTLNRDNNITTGKIYQGGRHHHLLESLTPVLRDSRSYFSVKRKSPYALKVSCHFLILFLDFVFCGCKLPFVYIEASCAAHPTADVLINFASYRSATASSMATLKQPNIRVVAIIAEGVPELDTKQLIAYALANNKVVIGLATVGGIQARAFKIGDTVGTIDNIIHCKLYRSGYVSFVSKSRCEVKEKGGLNQSSIYPTNNSTFKEDGENQNPNLSTPPMNQAKAMKATIKSSTEKKQPIESTTPNNEVLPKLRSTLSARNIMLGPNYDEEINKTVEKVVKLSKQLSHLKSLVTSNRLSRHPDAVTVVTGIVGSAGLTTEISHVTFFSYPTVVAIEAGKDIALANKETLIAGGPIVLPLAPKHNGSLVQKSFNSWAVTTVVEYFHLLPYAAIL
ncbi:hypothetical protein D8674_009888 [Pyrus ussuriensis x Pyrus communis]|uniref:Uncharacterized protein n=1 Tax=Pyrus ussuriensis x Pyrus communis TaxID=2448454 RepID=A0A5N5F9J6_9ROSA|nr:hypothetical protein D8674_009888 [Pyrus ussuriensis x Pyrus communis]